MARTKQGARRSDEEKRKSEELRRRLAREAEAAAAAAAAAESEADSESESESEAEAKGAEAEAAAESKVADRFAARYAAAQERVQQAAAARDAAEAALDEAYDALCLAHRDGEAYAREGLVPPRGPVPQRPRGKRARAEPPGRDGKRRRAARRNDEPYEGDRPPAARPGACHYYKRLPKTRCLKPAKPSLLYCSSHWYNVLDPRVPLGDPIRGLPGTPANASGLPHACKAFRQQHPDHFAGVL